MSRIVSIKPGELQSTTLVALLILTFALEVAARDADVYLMPD
jgi:hypothetical protein